jgi:type I restriction enzyme S subunit
MTANRKPIGELLEAVPRQQKIKRSEYQDSGRFPIVDQSQAAISGYTNDASRLYTGKLPVVVFGDHTRILKFVDYPFCVGADGTQLLRPVAGNDIRYFYYALRNVDLEHYGYERHFKYLKEKSIDVIAPREQQCIAGILSAYDELIENSLRRINILESMARSVYREWFVHFRFPGAENHPRVASALGEIPQGWEVKPIQHFGSVVTGKTPSKANADFYGDDVPFVKTPDMHGSMFLLDVNERLSIAGAKSQANKTLPSGSICVSCIGTIGVVSMTTQECQTNQQINSVILTNSASREFLFLRLQDAKQALENLGSNGATMGNVNKGKFESMEIVSPASELLAKFHHVVKPVFSEILALSRQIQNLRRTRDLLLPRLLSGQIKVDATP